MCLLGISGYIPYRWYTNNYYPLYPLVLLLSNGPNKNIIEDKKIAYCHTC